MKRRTLFGAILAVCSFGLLPRAPVREHPRMADFEPIWDDSRLSWVVLTDEGPEGRRWIQATPTDTPGNWRIKRYTALEQDEIDDMKNMVAVLERRVQRRRERAARMVT